MSQEPSSPAASATELTGIHTVRALALDAPRAANSGHQGTAMALAPLAHVLFTRVMTYDAAEPGWPDRDRFILSAGHASILQYSMLYLTGHGLTLDDLRQFRQWGSATPGHPEAGHTAGVEVTTGPLGQGFANAVGMALAERYLRSVYGEELCNHFTYVIAGDGDLSEGISHEAASLAGHLGLGKLIAVYDDNHISIDGPTDLALSDNAPERFSAYGWDVLELGRASEDLDALTDAFTEAKATTDRPSLIVLRTEIGFPSPTLTGHHSAHGLAFGDDEIAATKTVMNLPANESFHVPDDVLSMYRTAGSRGAEARAAWNDRLAASPSADSWRQALRQQLTFDDAEVAARFEVGASVATRKASQACVSALADANPNLIGGSADLTGNTGTEIDDVRQSAEQGTGRQIYFGIREHGMAAALVGAANHGGVVPIGGTFLVFADYMRPSVRLAAMSGARCVFVWTHDSVGVGEDGPTHQPIEQVMSLRAIPGLRVIRPADAVETVGAWRYIAETDGAVGLVLSRQGLPVLAGSRVDGVGDGAYAVVDVENPELILIGTGSEVSVCVDAAKRLATDGTAVRVISMPCWETFEERPQHERDALLDPAVPRISLEAGVTLGWDRYADVTIGIDRFGASAPGGTVLDKLGVNVENVCGAAKNLLADR